MNTLIYPLLVIIGFILGYVCCMFDYDRNFQRDLKELKRRDSGKEDE